MSYNILILGKGGQGTTFLALLLAESVFNEGKHALLTPKYEAGILGGNISVFLSISDHHENLTPDPSQFNILVNLNHFSPEIDYQLSPECIEIHAHSLHAFEIANQISFSRGLNLFMLGALLKKEPICSPQTIAWILKQKLGASRKYELAKNLELFKLGLALK